MQKGTKVKFFGSYTALRKDVHRDPVRRGKGKTFYPRMFPKEEAKASEFLKAMLKHVYH